jgi:putative colanic acid biosynthesis acetyltransferase WcaF
MLNLLRSFLILLCLSQGVYLCTGNHNWNHPNFQLIPAPIYIQEGSWIAAKSVIGPGVTIGKGAVLALGSVTGRSLEANIVYSGNPAEPIKKRTEWENLASDTSKN